MRTFLLLATICFFLNFTPLFAQLERQEFQIYSEENFLKNPGVIVGTITIRNPTKKRIKYKIIFQERGYKEHGKTIITIRPRGYGIYEFNPDYWDEKKAVYIVVWKRNSGYYYFSNWHKLNSGKKVKDSEDIFCFEVKENRITYFGNIEINDGKRTITRKNLKERDLSIIYKKYPNSNWDKFENGNIILNANNVE